MASKVTGLKPKAIHVHTTHLGGGFGRRLESDFVEEALQVSKATGKPVKLIWTREEDIGNDFYRPATCSRIEGGIDGKGRVIAWANKLVAPSIFSRVYPQMVRNGIDPVAVEGAVDMKYEIPNIHLEYVMVDAPVRVGFWRSVGHSLNAFTVESFVDELAHAVRKDPLEFRLGLLKNRPRPRRVLEVAAEKACWGKSLTKGHGRGIAQHFSFGSYVAQVAEVSVNKKDGTVKVHRIICAVDCGPVINPDTVSAQMEGGIIFGLSAALKEKIQFARGGVESANFHNYEILPMSETPEIEVHIVKSDAKLGGVGEPGVPPAAPSMANAVFAATGIRVRRLPMKPETVMEIIKKEKGGNRYGAV
jgi:isoquinoline 1-oxidoreductase beta subunit